MSAGRGICPICDRSVRTSSGGLLGVHLNNHGSVCRGVGRLPVGRTVSHVHVCTQCSARWDEDA